MPSAEPLSTPEPDAWNLEQSLRAWVTGQTGAAEQTVQQLLTDHLLSQIWQMQAFQLTPASAAERVQQRLDRFRILHPALSQFCQFKLGWADYSLSQAWELWLPLAEQLIVWQQALNRPLILGILGIQGTGKTTLTRILAAILAELGQQVAYLSIDDLYKTYAERQQLQQLDPRFSWRGPPGTHDVELGLSLLQQVRQCQFPIALPRFDKSAHRGAGDRTQPELIDQTQFVLFEGWFVGVQPIDPQQFETAPAPILTAADRDFAREVNRQLQGYLPLWDLLDRWLVLYPSDYRLSQEWRWQAEQQMQAGGRSGMSAEAVKQFVEYFWRALHPELFVKPLLDSAAIDLVVRIGANHQVEAIDSPRASASATSTR